MKIEKSVLVAVLAAGFGLAMVGCGGGGSTSAPAKSAGDKSTASTVDSDDDGFFDDVDECPHDKEDGKGTKPKDGCPDKG